MSSSPPEGGKKRGVFIFGPSFSGLNITGEILSKELEKATNRRIGSFDIEEKIKEIAREEGKEGGEDKKPPPMYDLILSRTRREMRDLWRKSLEQIFQEIEEERYDLFFITGHSIYFKEIYNSFFSPVDLAYLFSLLRKRDIHIGAVITIFDDIFDMIIRHSQVEKGPMHPRVFYWDRKRVLRARLQLDEEEISALARSEVLLRLASLFLRWRRLELITSEMIATSLSSKFIPFAVKNPKIIFQKVVDLALKGDNIYLAYLSHSISFFRRYWEKGEELPKEKEELVRAINRIPFLLNYDGIAVISPSSIDELRFERDSEGLFTGRLTRRWELLDGTLYERIEEKRGGKFHQEERESLIRELFFPSLPRNSGLIEADPLPSPSKKLRRHLHEKILPVVDEITSQIGERDHLLVCHADFLISFHPLREKEGEISISDGVFREVEHWRRRAEREKRKSVFIYLRDNMLLSFILKNMCDLLEESIKSVLRERTNLPDGVIDEIFRQIWGEKEGKGKSPLYTPPSGVIWGIKKDKEAIEVEALKKIIERVLTLETPYSSLFLFEDIESLERQRNLEQIFDFLLSKERRGEGASEQIAPLLEEVISSYKGDCSIIKSLSFHKSS